MKDTCVLCGEETEYDETVHIDFRVYYIEGCGQLCRPCGEKTEGDSAIFSVVSRSDKDPWPKPTY